MDDEIERLVRERDERLAEIGSGKRELAARRERRRAGLAARGLDVVVQACGTVVGGLALAVIAWLTGIIERTPATDAVAAVGVIVSVVGTIAMAIFTARTARRTDAAWEEEAIRRRYSDEIAAIAEARAHRPDVDPPTS